MCFRKAIAETTLIGVGVGVGVSYVTGKYYAII